MSVHYKFKSAVEYDTLPVDGLNISLGDLKEAIILQKRLGKAQPYDLQITNAETKEVYTDEKTLIPKNSSLIVARVPIDPSHLKRGWETKDSTALILSNPANIMNTEDAAEAAEIDRKIKEVTDLTRMEGSEQDKINAMVAQSTMEYHPSRYVKLRASKMTGAVPIGYSCYKCNQPGHWVTFCPLNNQDLRKSTGIPSMFLEEVDDPTAPGVMITASGKFVRLRDMVCDANNRNVYPPGERPSPPEELECQLCKDLLKDAVLIPCCAAAFCDECIRNHLLDSEEHICPTCEKEGIGPDTLIPNRYLRIKVQQFENGWFANEKKTDGVSEGSELLSSVPGHVLQVRNTPTPPHSPAHSISPVKIRLEKQLMTSPISHNSLSPMHSSSPLRVPSAEPFGNGDIGSDKENTIEKENFETKTEVGDSVNVDESDRIPPESFSDHESLAVAEEKENIELNEAESDIDEKPKKVKKKKSKRKNSRHDNDEENDERERKKRERKSSHKSHDRKSSSSEKKSKRRDAELLKDVADLPEDKMEMWDDDRSIDNHDDLVTSKKKKKHHSKDSAREPVTSTDEQEELWNSDRIKRSRSSDRMKRSRSSDRIKRSQSRSRSNSIEKERHSATAPLFVPFNPLVPPPNFLKSPKSQDFHYPLTSTFVPPVTHPIPVTSVTNYPHYQPGIPPPTLSNPPISYPRHHSTYSERELIADPLTEFEKHLREKDERARRNRYSRSRSLSRSPRYRRGRSRSRQRTWSRSRSRSVSRPRVGGISTHSPRSPSRRRWSRSPPPRGHGTAYRSRSPSFSRDRSLSNRSVSLSRTPSPNRRILSPSVPLHPVHQPVHPEALLSRPPPVDFGVPRDYSRFPMGSLPQDQFPPQPGYHPINPHWDSRYPPVMSENFKPNFSEQRGRGMRGRRGRGFFGYDQRGQDYRNHYDRRGGGPVWDRDRQNYNVELARSDRGNRHSDGERRRYGEHSDYEEKRPRRDNSETSRRYDDSGHGHIFSSDDEWRRYPDDGKKRDDDSDRRRYEGRRKEDSDSRRLSDPDDIEEYKKSRKDNESRRSFERSYKDADDSRSSRHEREEKHKSTHRDSPRDEDVPFRSKPYDSPGKSHKKSSPKERRDRDSDRKDREVEKKGRESDRRDKDIERRDRDIDKRERESDKREREDRRVKDSDRRDRDADRRERDDKRDRDSEKQERDSGRREKDKDYDRKDSYRKDREQDRKLRDGDRKDDRRDRDSSKRDKETASKDKGERNDDDLRKDRDADRSYGYRWDHPDPKSRSDKEMEVERKSQEKEKSIANEEKEHRRKSKRKEEKEESHQKEKGDDADGEKIEKKKHEKKKKKKEKRRASQASTELSQGEMTADEGEDKKKKKKRDKKKKSKGVNVEEGSGENIDSSKLPANDIPPSEDGVASEPVQDSVPVTFEEMDPQDKTSDAEPKEESPSTLLPLPPLSKWERDEELILTPKGLIENKAPEEERKVTDDILKRAENTLFSGGGSGRGLASRKVFLDPQKQKDNEEKERSPTPEWDRMETREAKRRGTSIQITISSKTESQIGRPRGGRYQPSSPERTEDTRYPLRSRRSTDSEGKPDKHSRTRRRSQSPPESQSSIKTRRKSEKEEQMKEEKSSTVNMESTDKTEESSSLGKKLKLEDTDSSKSMTEDDAQNVKSLQSIMKEDNIQENMSLNESEFSIEACSTSQENIPCELPDKLIKDENIQLHKGVKRSSTSNDELEVKKLKIEVESSTSETNEPNSSEGNFVNVEKVEFAIPVLGESNKKEIKNPEPIIHTNSNLVQVPISSGEGDDLEEGEIPTDSSGDVEGDIEVAADKLTIEAPIELRGVVIGNAIEKHDKAGVTKGHSPIRVPAAAQPEKVKEVPKVKEKSKKRKKRKRSSSSSSSNSSSSSSSSSSSEDEEIVKKKKKKKKKKKAVDSDSSDGESQKKHKKKKKEKKKKRKKDKKKKSDK